MISNVNPVVAKFYDQKEAEDIFDRVCDLNDKDPDIATTFALLIFRGKIVAQHGSKLLLNYVVD